MGGRGAGCTCSAARHLHHRLRRLDEPDLERDRTGRSAALRMTSRERISLVLGGGIPDRVPIHDGYWDDALERWKGEGLPESVASDKEDSLGEHFGTEIRLIRIDDSFLFEERVLEEDERYIT